MDRFSFVAADCPLPAVRTLLAEVFDGTRYTQAFLDWLYRDNPWGHEIAVNLVDGDTCAAHYAIIPQMWTGPGRDAPISVGLSLNTAVAEAWRGRGAFTFLAQTTYARAAEDHGTCAVVGVGNAKSTHGLIHSLGFQHVCQLPVRIGMVLPCPRSTVRRVTVDDLDAALLSGEAPLQHNQGWQQFWTRDVLRWRLASPLSRFQIHATADAAMITCRTFQKGVPFMVILKILTVPGYRPPVRALMSAAAASHKTPLYVYAGLNADVQIGGLPLPRALRPSPLNLVYLPLRPEAPSTMTPVNFEFLDFDAY